MQPLSQTIAGAAPLRATAAPVTHTAEPRYAIYFAPPRDSAWWRFGCAWLGRDPITDENIEHPLLYAVDAARVESFTATPRRYGFHATLKPPFELSRDYAAHHVYAQAANLAITLKPAPLASLRLMEIGDFVALSFARDDGASAACGLIAAQCVACFDNLRAPPGAAELARRHAAGLTPRQQQLLAAWGYPYVFDEYRFHLTLTGPLTSGERRHVIDALAPWVAELQTQALTLDALTIYRQRAVGEPFVVMRRYGFDGTLEIYRDE